MTKKEVLTWATLEKRRAKLRGEKDPLKKGKPFKYVVVFYPLKKGKKFIVTSINEVEGIVRNGNGSFPRDVLSTRKMLAVANNKLYFYELKFTPDKYTYGETTSRLTNKKLGFVKCTDYDKLIELVYGTGGVPLNWGRP